MLHLPNGEKVAQDLLSKGYIELTEENAKIYGDSFELANRNRNNPTRVPSKKELVTGIDGSNYLRNIMNKDLQSEIDYTEEELEKYGINTKTPLSIREERARNITKDETVPDEEKTTEQREGNEGIEI